MINLVVVCWGPDDQECFQRVLLGFVVWGFEKLIFGGFDKKKIFFLQITHNGEHIKNSKKISKNFIFLWGWIVRVNNQESFNYAIIVTDISQTEINFTFIWNVALGHYKHMLHQI